MIGLALAAGAGCAGHGSAVGQADDAVVPGSPAGPATPEVWQVGETGPGAAITGPGAAAVPGPQLSGAGSDSSAIHIDPRALQRARRARADRN